MRGAPIGLAVLLLIAEPAGAQEQPAVPPPAPSMPAPPASAPEPDVVVEGYRLRKSPETRAQVPAMSSAVASRRAYEFSERLAKCAARSRLSDRRRLRAVVDGEVNSPAHSYAQYRLVTTYISCAESAQLGFFSTVPRPASGFAAAALAGDTSGLGSSPDGAPLGHSIYDRGAFTIQALKFFAPDLRLTREELDDPAVRERFVLRETARNRFRFALDRRYFEVAACVVRREPRLAVRLALSDGAARLGDLQEVLIDRTRACVGNPKRVQVDSTQFRLYVADAVYRWAVAVRNVGSLIPAEVAEVPKAAGS